MKFLSSLALSLSLALGTLLSGTDAQATVIGNTPTGGSISPFGTPDTFTYGQVFVAPVTGTLDNFTLYLNGGVGDIVGAVGTWNGTATFGFGFGSPTTLYTSSEVTSGPGGQTFAPGISVTAGNIYVAFITVFGLGNPGATTSMPLGGTLPGGGYFVFNNTTDPFDNSSWNYFLNAGNVQFTASFTPSAAVVPLPAGGFLLIGALGGLAALRRRKTA